MEAFPKVSSVHMNQAVAVEASGRRGVTHAAWLYLLSIAAALFWFSGRYDPDFESYRLLYEFGGSWLQALGRDPLFVFFVKFFGERLSYEHFRYALCAVFSVALWRLANRFRTMSPEGFGLVQALFLTPLILLKFHVQIREGLALVIWLFAMTRKDGINIRSPWFWGSAVISSALHIGVTVLWAATLLLGLLKKHYAAAMILLLCSAYGLAITSGRDFLLAPFVKEHEVFFRDTGFDVEITSAKLLYWSVFLALPLLALIRFQPTAFGTFGTIGIYGLLGFFPAALFFGSGEGETSNVLRVASTLMTLLGIQLSMTRPRSVLTWTILVFALSDALRRILD